VGRECIVSYKIKLDTFEGPLDLLLHLIDKEEMDIYDISISKITDQYLEYIHKMQSLRLDITSEFLVMAATLLSIKSKMLLPKREEEPFLQMFDDGEEDDPRDELVLRLLEYKKYKLIANDLKEKETERSKIFTKAPSNLNTFQTEHIKNPVEGVSLYQLVDAFEKALTKLTYNEPLKRIEREEISVTDRMNSIIQLLRHHPSGFMQFSELFSQDYNKSELVTTFLSILELMRQKIITCVQSDAFDDIVIHYSPKEGVE